MEYCFDFYSKPKTIHQTDIKILWVTSPLKLENRPDTRIALVTVGLENNMSDEISSNFAKQMIM